MKLEKIDHLCIAVKDVKKAEAVYSRAFDMQPIDYYVDENEKILWSTYRLTSKHGGI